MVEILAILGVALLPHPLQSRQQGMGAILFVQLNFTPTTA